MDGQPFSNSKSRRRNAISLTVSNSLDRVVLAKLGNYLWKLKEEYKSCISYGFLSSFEKLKRQTLQKYCWF
jgi:hypothetical protein